jgi:hypothetical protein
MHHKTLLHRPDSGAEENFPFLALTNVDKLQERKKSMKL